MTAENSAEYWHQIADERSAEIVRLNEEADESDRLRAQLSDILTRTADALKGPPDYLTAHSWHDLPELAALAMKREEPEGTGAQYSFDEALNLGRLWAAGKLIGGDPYAAAAAMARAFDHDSAALAGIETPPDPDTVDRAITADELAQELAECSGEIAWLRKALESIEGGEVMDAPELRAIARIALGLS